MATTREEFLATIREAVGQRRASATHPVPPDVDESLARLADADDPIADLFAERAASVGMLVRRVRESGLTTALLDTLRDAEVVRVTLAIDSIRNEDVLKDAMARVGIDIRPWHRDRLMLEHWQADAGITDVHAAIAETGTLVCHSDSLHGRGHSLAPPVHIAIVRASDILPDLVDYMKRMDALPHDELPSAAALITGPSKTADIEGILITGVHGPKRVYILLVEDV